MDDIVRQAMAKWPNVPHCHGWLGLDSRGRWFLRDEAVQARGPFPRDKGEEIRHEALLAFIARNYGADAQGRWFFQNGPQRVFVELELTPFVWRVQGDGSVAAHTGQDAGAVRECLLDEHGRLLLACELGLGLVHSLDMERAAAQIEAGRWTPEPVDCSALEQRFGYVRSPALQALPEGVRRVAAALAAAGHPHAPRLLDGAARTAQQAADALGVAVGQIAKSIIFRRERDGAAVLVIASGDRRVDEAKVVARVGAIGRADAAFVKQATGFSIGGVAPLAHHHAPVTLIDADLFRFDVVWAAAGHPHGVFALQPQDLVHLTGAPVVDVVQEPHD